MSVQVVAQATIYQCLYGYDRNVTLQCRTHNQGKRDKCKGCKGPVHAITGHAIIAHWRGDGNYTLADAIKTYASYGAAERAADRLYQSDPSSNVVARFVSL
ncbi:hypothetical protein PBI_REDNO2_217 [Mycobacterium phage Redno2]|uniref:hypothetical protein n=1 Tax=Mycobacterium phage Redno2 TaxID=1340709 RepID=UPI000387A546|nr:hypothetical protein N860_gp191 [Mycobacterium phage Redno2]AGS82515.1 hypothetical protein PBI_REDNO2_217 [Mycobacterium phage Redno2]